MLRFCIVFVLFVHDCSFLRLISLVIVSVDTSFSSTTSTIWRFMCICKSKMANVYCTSLRERDRQEYRYLRENETFVHHQLSYDKKNTKESLSYLNRPACLKDNCESIRQLNESKENLYRLPLSLSNSLHYLI